MHWVRYARGSTTVLRNLLPRAVAVGSMNIQQCSVFVHFIHFCGMCSSTHFQAIPLRQILLRHGELSESYAKISLGDFYLIFSIGLVKRSRVNAASHTKHKKRANSKRTRQSVCSAEKNSTHARGHFIFLRLQTMKPSVIMAD